MWSYLYVVPMILLLLLQGFFSGSEIAVVAADRKKMKLRADEGSKGSQLALRLLKEPEWYLSTTLLGTNLSVIANTVLITGIMLEFLGRHGEILAIFLLPPILVILGEIVPKTLFQQHATSLAPKIAPFIWATVYLLYPIVFMVSKVTRMMLSLVGVTETRLGPLVTREELGMLLHLDETELDIEKRQKTVIQRILSFSDTRVKEVMIPLIDVAAIKEDCQISEALEVFQNTRHSRLPVFKGRIDRIIGLVNAFDLIDQIRETDAIRPFIRKIYYVPETKYVDQLLIELQRKRIHMAAVVDEYGGAVGIVTIEDLLEEIVGEIRDEFDTEEPYYVRIGEGRYLVSARMEVNAFAETLRIKLPRGDYETLGGFILQKLGYIPKAGETVLHGNLTFIIKRSSERDIKEVEVIVKDEKKDIP